MFKTMLPLMGGALILAGCGTTPPAASLGEVVQPRLGAVRGESVADGGATAVIYRGIPYAAPPVGPLRWRPPQPAHAWTGVRDATRWPSRCPQGESSMGAATPLSEDCLY